MSAIFGGVETGGTWCVCAIGRGPGELLAREQFRTGTPADTLAQIERFFAGQPAVQAIGVGSFGPVQLDREAENWGAVTSTPKPGWAHTPVASVLEQRLGVPVAFDLDVTTAAIGEHRWGAGRGVSSLCYLTIGTGIGAGLLIDGRPVHGLIHPEVGHLFVPHDRTRDPFPGCCEFHGDCWEGLAAGPALAARWEADPAALPDDHPAWELEVEYVAHGLLAIVSVASPERIIAGGGVLERPGLLPRIGARLSRLVNGYLDTPALAGEVGRYLVAPELGDDAGVLGAIALARQLVGE